MEQRQRTLLKRFPLRAVVIAMSYSCEKDLIYDVGLHKGEDSEFYLKGFRVVAIEAVPSLAQQAAERLRDYLTSGQLVILNVAIAKEDGPMTFFEDRRCSIWGTAFPERLLGDDCVQIKVQGLRFANILRKHGIPYYLKVDIEGAETLCLEALESFSAKPRYISIEPSGPSREHLLRIFTLLRALGYSKFKVVRQDEVPAQRCPFPAKEGRYIDYHFEGTASGMFGEEAPGDWIDEAEAIRIHRSISLKIRFLDGLARVHLLRLLRPFVPSAIWCDTHAAIE